MSKFDILERKLRKELELEGCKSTNGKFITYRSIQHKCALGDFGTEYWTEDDWSKYEDRVAKMKADGTYLKPYISELTLQHHPEFDEPKTTNKVMESYRMVILDFNK